MKTLLKTALNWRYRAPGSASSLGFFLLFFSLTVFAQKEIDDEKGVNPFVRPATNLTDTTPYVPKKRDYSLELGAIGQDTAFYWIGGHVGFHIGKCLWTTQVCQQYLDIFSGFAGQDFDRQVWVTPSLRWQLINYPSPWSHFFRVMIGYSNLQINEKTLHEPLFVVGYGVTRYLHDRLDVRLEMRYGVNHTDFVQGTVGLQLKIDKWVEFFADKIKGLGEATGDLITSPFKEDKKDSKKK